MPFVIIRTLAAADNAVMLVDAGKGLEPQTRKLFEVSASVNVFTLNDSKIDSWSCCPLLS